LVKGLPASPHLPARHHPWPGQPQPDHERSHSGRHGALRIPALSAGWRGSFQALLEEQSGGATTGNAGFAAVSGPPPAWAGFRPLRVSQKIRESSSVMSLVLEPVDELSLTAALPGQFPLSEVKRKTCARIELFRF